MLHKFQTKSGFRGIRKEMSAESFADGRCGEFDKSTLFQQSMERDILILPENRRGKPDSPPLSFRQCHGIKLVLCKASRTISEISLTYLLTD
jgi:hypothetical protein